MRSVRFGGDRPGRDRGSVTAEAAVAMPALFLVLGIALWAVDVAAVKVACVDAARSGARAAARGEPISAVRAATLKALPSGGGQVDISRDTTTTTISVHVTVRPPARLLMPAITLSEQATAATEPQPP